MSTDELFRAVMLGEISLTDLDSSDPTMTRSEPRGWGESALHWRRELAEVRTQHNFPHIASGYPLTDDERRLLGMSAQIKALQHSVQALRETRGPASGATATRLENPTPTQLRELLQAAGWTQQHAADLVGLDLRSMQRACKLSGKQLLDGARWALLQLIASASARQSLPAAVLP